MISVKNLSKSYGVRHVIHSLNFEIHAGEVVGFLGPNGAGKSTTLRMITGHLPPTEGEIWINGYSLEESALEIKKELGYLPEQPPLYLDQTVEEYLEFCGKLHQMNSTQLKKSKDQLLQKTGLTEVRKRLIGNLSKGTKQRVGIASVLLHNPKTIILDEPTVGLDPKQMVEIRKLIQSLAGEHTVLLSSHLLSEITETCSRVIVLHEGRMITQESIAHLQNRLSDPSSHQGVHLRLKLNTLNTATEKALQEIPGLTLLHSKKTSNSVELSLQVDPAQVSSVLSLQSLQAQIVQSCVLNQAGVIEFYPEKTSLEDVFIKLTTTQGAIK